MENVNFFQQIRTSLTTFAAFFSLYQFAHCQRQVCQLEAKKKEYNSIETKFVSDVATSQENQLYFIQGIPKLQSEKISIFNEESRKKQKKLLFQVSQKRAIYSNDQYNQAKFNRSKDYQVLQRLESFSLVDSQQQSVLQKLSTELKNNYSKIEKKQKKQNRMKKILDAFQIQNYQIQIDINKQTNSQYAHVYLGPRINIDLSSLSFPQKLWHYFSYIFSGFFKFFGLIDFIQGDWAFKGAKIAYVDQKFGIQATGMLSVLGSVIYDNYKKQYIVDNPILLTLSKDHLLYEITNQINNLLRQRDFWLLCGIGFGFLIWKEHKNFIKSKFHKYWDKTKNFIMKKIEQFRETPSSNINKSLNLDIDPDALMAFKQEDKVIPQNPQLINEESKTST